MIKLKKIIRSIPFVYISLCVFCVFAEVQTWTMKDGSTIEAEFVILSGPLAALKFEGGAIRKLPFDDFTEESQRRLELEFPPKLTFSLTRDERIETFAKSYVTDERTKRPDEKRVHYGVDITGRSSRPYNHPLHLELFIIGYELNGDKYILLDRQQSTFYLSQEDGNQYSFKSPREVALQNYEVQEDLRGEDYYGYLVIVKDERNKIVGKETSRPWLLENIERLEERYTGNYMDKTCTRTYPTRPVLPYMY